VLSKTKEVYDYSLKREKQ